MITLPRWTRAQEEPATEVLNVLHIEHQRGAELIPMNPYKHKLRKTSNAKSVPLLACPHCGATQDDLDKRNGKGIYAYLNAPSSDIQPWLHVVCLECGGSAPSIEAWNRNPNHEPG